MVEAGAAAKAETPEGGYARRRRSALKHTQHTGYVAIADPR